MQTFARTIALALTPLALGACAGGSGGGLGDILGSVLGGGAQGTAGSGALVVEVQDVDERNQEIEVLTDDGQRGPIAYDQNTTVSYQNQQYPVTALERGDIVEMRVQQLSDGGYYTDQIVVQQSVQERGGASGGSANLVQVAGTVRSIDYQAGWFTLDTNQDVVTVSLPYNPPIATVGVFERLDRGDQVSVEGRLIASDRVELVRFR